MTELIYMPVWALCSSLFLLSRLFFLASVFSASSHPIADVADESLSRTYYFYPTLDEKVRVFYLTSLQRIEADLESRRMILESLKILLLNRDCRHSVYSLRLHQVVRE